MASLASEIISDSSLPNNLTAAEFSSSGEFPIATVKFDFTLSGIPLFAIAYDKVMLIANGLRDI